MRLVEIRLLDGPNVYRPDPTVKVEVSVGRRRSWYGQRSPGRYAIVSLGARVPQRVTGPMRSPSSPAGADDSGSRPAKGGPASPSTSPRIPGIWIVTFPWTGAERARAVADGAVELAMRGVSSTKRAQLTGPQSRLFGRVLERVAAAKSTPPSWVRDVDRTVPIVSISGTNGKSTVTRLITHILVRAGRRVGTTTSDGVYVDERLVEAGDWTGPGGAAQVLSRSDVGVAILETARGGILLRGVGYESNEASILTNVTSDHLDLQGIHTLPELAEVKATICRITKPDGWVVLNADDPLVAAVGRRVRAQVALFSIDGDAEPRFRRHVAAGGRGYTVRRGVVVEVDGGRTTDIAPVLEVPITIGGLARHNIANALAAAGGARAVGATLDEVADGLRDFRPSTDRSPGRLNLFRLGQRLVIVDFAHNEAGISAVLDVAEGIAGGAAGRTVPITVIVGTAGDRPDDTLRGIGRIAAQRAQRIAIKETLDYLRGRSREHVAGEILAGVVEGGGRADDVVVYESETAALRGELNGAGGRPDAPRVIVLMCHAEREAVFELLDDLGARPIDVTAELTTLVPRLQDRPRRD